MMTVFKFLLTQEFDPNCTWDTFVKAFLETGACIPASSWGDGGLASERIRHSSTLWDNGYAWLIRSGQYRRVGYFPSTFGYWACLAEYVLLGESARSIKHFVSQRKYAHQCIFVYGEPVRNKGLLTRSTEHLDI